MSRARPIPHVVPDWILPLWLAGCVVLGGANAAGIAANLILQLCAAGIIALALLVPSNLARSPLESAILIVFGGIFGWAVLTLIPLPSSVWSALPGRAGVAEGYRLLGMDLPALSLSLNSERTLRSLVSLFVPVATFLMVRRQSPRGIRLSCQALVALGILSVMFGLAQQAGGIGSPLRFYDITNPDSPVGFFSNANHFAALIVMTIPFVGALANDWKGVDKRVSSRVRRLPWPVFAGLAALMAIGVLAGRSVAGLGLLLPAIASAIMLYLHKGQRGHISPVKLAALGAMALAAVIALYAVGSGSIGAKFDQTPGSRKVTNVVAWEAVKEFTPTGSGLGTFAQVYAAREPIELVTDTWMNQAHNDVLQTALELGVPGILAMLGFAAIVGLIGWRQWFAPEAEGASAIGRAAIVGVVLVMIHSFVDYPLRAATIAAVFAFLLALSVHDFRAPLAEKASDE